MIRIFKHYISSAYLWLLIVEWLIFYLAMYWGSDVRFLKLSSWYSDESIVVASIIFSCILTLVCMGLGLYRRSLNWQDYNLVLRVCVSFALAAVAIISFYYLFPEYQIARSVFIYALVFAFLGMMLSRYFFYRYVSLNKILRRVLVLGVGEKALQLMAINNEYIHKGFVIVGFVPSGEGKVHVEISLVIGQEQDLTQIIGEYNVEEIVVAVDDKRNSLPLNCLLKCKTLGVRIIDLLNFYEREQGLILLDSHTMGWIIFQMGLNLVALK